MKKKQLFTFFLVVAMSLGVAHKSVAQNAPVSLSLENVKLEKVLNDIEKQTNYLFVYTQHVNVQQNVSVVAERKNLHEVLSQLFAGTDITWVVEGSNIVLSQRDLQKEATGQRMRTVAGRVTNQAGEPIIGVTVVVKGTTVGTVTSLAGNFTLNVGENARTLVFSFLGMESKEVPIGNTSNFNVTLSEEAFAVDRVVVTALGIKRQEKALSYNVQTIDSDELTTVKSANFVNALAGKVAGVQLNASSGPGGAVKVVARGEKSIEKSNLVLYVIDGIPMYNHSFGGGSGTFGGGGGSESVADINPEDIESVNMLTGASAAALYGSEAANGVILINTKRGVEGRARVTVSNSTIFSKAYMLPDMQHTYGTSVGFENWGNKYDSRAFDPREFFNTGVNLINSVALSTGNAHNQTYLSTSSTNATGIIPGNTYDRYNFTARNTSKFLEDKMTLDIGAGLVLQHDKNMVSQGIYFNPITSLYLFPRSENFLEARMYERYDPNANAMMQFWPYGENGSYILQNPYWIQNRMNRELNKQRYMLNASLSYEILNWLSVKGRANIDNASYLATRKFHAGTNENFAGPLGGYSEDMQTDRSFYGDVMLNVNYKCYKLSLNGNVGASINDQRFHQNGGAGNLNTSPNEFVYSNIDFRNKYRPLSGGWTEQIQSVFASAEVGWDAMLYLTATARHEWPSQLAFSSQSSYFYPSVGLSAVISNMINAPKWLTFLKLRGSYSEVGAPYGRYLSHPGNNFNNEQYEWSSPTTYPHRNMKPELTKSSEAGLDARFFGGKLTLDATFYRSNTYNQTLYAAVPSSSGYSNMIVQAGNVQNEGIELALGYKNKWGGFGWSTFYTFTTNRNSIKDLGTGAINPLTGEALTHTFIEKDWLGSGNVAPQVRLVKGGSMSDIYINHQIKRDNDGYVDMTTGNIMMERIEFLKVGQLSPKATMAWGNSFSYAGFDLGATISARLGGVVYSATQGALDYFGTSQVSATVRDNGGIPVNFGSIDAQKYYQAIATPLGGYGAYYLYSATNVRLQELSLSYTLPKKWFRDNMGLSLGFVARNLLMIYCKAPFDPEVSPSPGSTYYQGVDLFMQPSSRELGFNVKLSF